MSYKKVSKRIEGEEMDTVLEDIFNNFYFLITYSDKVNLRSGIVLREEKHTKQKQLMYINS